MKSRAATLIAIVITFFCANGASAMVDNPFGESMDIIVEISNMADTRGPIDKKDLDKLNKQQERLLKLMDEMEERDENCARFIIKNYLQRKIGSIFNRAKQQPELEKPEKRRRLIEQEKKDKEEAIKKFREEHPEAILPRRRPAPTLTGQRRENHISQLAAEFRRANQQRKQEIIEELEALGARSRLIKSLKQQLGQP